LVLANYQSRASRLALKRSLVEHERASALKAFTKASRGGDLTAAGRALERVPSWSLLSTSAPVQDLQLALSRVFFLGPRRRHWHALTLEDPSLRARAQDWLERRLGPVLLEDALVLAHGFDGTLGDVAVLTTELA
jgi:hypothetical protein